MKIQIVCILLSFTLMGINTQKVDYAAKIQSLKTANFESVTKNQGPNIVSFIMFSAGWCGHCRHFISDGYGDFIKAVSEDKDHPYEVRFFNHKLDDKENSREYFERFGINAFPSFVAIRDNMIYRHEGPRSPEKLLEFTKSFEGGEIFPGKVTIVDTVMKEIHAIKSDIQKEIKKNPTRTYGILFLVLCLFIATPILTFKCMNAIEDSCKGPRNEARRKVPVTEEDIKKSEEPNPLADDDVDKKER